MGVVAFGVGKHSIEATGGSVFERPDQTKIPQYSGSVAWHTTQRFLRKSLLEQSVVLMSICKWFLRI